MAVERRRENCPIDPHAVGLALAERVRNDPSVERLWVFAYRDVVQLWLLTLDVPADDEYRLYGLLDDMYELFPLAEVQLHLISPRYFDPLELDVILPPGSAEIALDAA
jgi:hypothetical protein